MTRIPAMVVLLVATPAWAYETIEVSNGGSVRGKVTMEDVPQPAERPVTKDRGACGDTVPDERYVVGGKGQLANVVVEVAGITRGKARSKEPVVIDQRKCRFVPHVTAFMKGTKLLLKNSDNVLHNAHTYIEERDVFNRALPPHAEVKQKVKKSGVMHYQCDAGHGWMEAWSYVAPHPYVAVTNADGEFVIDDIPPGSYTLRFWHEAAGERTKKVVVNARGASEVSVQF